MIQRRQRQTRSLLRPIAGMGVRGAVILPAIDRLGMIVVCTGCCTRNCG